MKLMQITYKLICIVIAFSVIFILNVDYIHMPPVWDTTSGVFAPAIYLYNSGYDLYSLAKKGGYFYAEPNTYSLNLITQLTYLAILITEANTAQYIPALHIIQLIFATFGILGVFHIARHRLGNIIAFLCCIWLLFFPLFSVQLSYLYTELPGLVFVLWASIAWAHRKYGWMLSLTVLSYLVKSFALVGVVFFAVAIPLDQKLTIRERVTLTISLIIIPFLIEIITRLFSDLVSPPALGCTWPEYFLKIISYLRESPDLFLLIILSIVTSVMFFIRYKAKAITALNNMLISNYTDRIWIAVFAIPLIFYSFILTVNLVHPSFFPLVRYYVWILPFLILGMTYVIFNIFLAEVKDDFHFPEKLKKYLSIILLISLISFSWLNRKGELYPRHGVYRSFSYAERSFEYLSYFRVQKSLIQKANKYGKGLPAFFTRGTYYMASSRLMGYANSIDFLPFFILTFPYASANLSYLPNTFLLVDSESSDFHGQSVMNKVLEEATANSDYKVIMVSESIEEPYHGKLYRITRQN